MFARALLVVLVVVNLGVAAWWIGRPPPVADDVRDQAPGVPRLELLSERPMPVASRPVPVLCLRIGPFDVDGPALAEARQRVGVQAEASRTVVEDGGPPSRWRVMLPPSLDEDAGALAQRVREAGFSDVQPVREGDDAGNVALGVYGSEAAAGAHRDALRAAGFPAQLDPSGGERAWLVAGFDAAQARDLDPGRLRIEVAALRAAPVECDAFMADGEAAHAAGTGQ